MSAMNFISKSVRSQNEESKYIYQYIFSQLSHCCCCVH